MKGPLLVLDTATRTPLLALATHEGGLIARRAWTSRHRHGEELLERLDELIAEAGIGRGDFGAVVVGTGPGSFTGLRIGLATAKVIAYSLQIPLLGLSTTHGLALAAGAGRSGQVAFAIALPAGVADRYVHLIRVDGGETNVVELPRLVAGDEALIEAAGDAELVAVDLEDAQLPGEAVERGRDAVDGLPAALATVGARRLVAGERSDAATLVPAYVALPRGLAEIAGDIEWSVDRR